MEILFYIIFTIEIAIVITILEKLDFKIKLRHRKIYNIIGFFLMFIFFLSSGYITFCSFNNFNLLGFIFGFILLCLAFLSAELVKSKYGSITSKWN